MRNIAIIYHDADFDGKLSNEVCRYHLSGLHPEAAIHSYGWDYGRPVPTCRLTYQLDSNPNEPTREAWHLYDAIYIVDLSVDELMARPELRDKIIWIDHHKSAIEKWDKLVPVDGEHHPDNPVGTRPLFRGVRIDGVAACRLCWQWFTWGKLPKGVLPSKQDYIEPLTQQLFIDRKVSEPELIRLAGEYDIWDHRDPDGKALQFGLRALSESELRDLVAKQLGNSGSEFDRGMAFIAIRSAVKNGHAIKSYCDRQNDGYSHDCAHTIQWEGLTFCALNIGQRGNSDLLRGGLKPEHQACFAWRYVNGKALVSLYHAPGHEHIDLSLIAVKYGGGGHKGACGFRATLTELDAIFSQ